MSHLSGGVIHLDGSDADVEEVGSDVEEVITWDHKLRGTKTFSTGFLILSSVLVLATVTSELEGTARRVPSGDSNGGGWA